MHEGEAVAPHPFPGVFVAGTGTDVGKTVCAGALLRALRRRGVRVQAVKPVQTGVPRIGTSGAWDAAVYGRAAEGPPEIPGLAPGCTLRSFAFPGSPHLAAALEGQALTAEGIAQDVRQHWRSLHEGGADPALLVLEGAGSLGTPLNATQCMADVAALLEVPVLLVADAGLGGLGHVLAGLEMLAARGLEPVCVALVEPSVAPGDDALVGAARTIVGDTRRFLEERFAADGSGTGVALLPRQPILDAEGWEALAVLLAPLAERIAPRPDSAGDIVARDREMLWHPYAGCRAEGLQAVARTRGNRLVLADGRELVDGMSSWWAAIHGYNHPRLARALAVQAGRMPHVMFGGLTHGPAVRLGERLLARMPAGLERVFFADSGSVAVEVAMKMALQYQQGMGRPGRNRFLTVRGGYHGDTLGAMSVCDPVNGMHGLFSGYVPRHIFLDRPSCPFDGDYEGQGIAEAQAVIERCGNAVAGLIIEPVVQGAGGMWFYHPGFLRDLVNLCRKAGIVVILDEIATGFGRTGRYFAAEWAGVTPDVLCCGKALTGGTLTLAATVCTDQVACGICRMGDAFMHGPTFMASPLACAVASASLDELERGVWPDQVAELETAMRRGLAPCRDVPGVRDVRVLGGIGVVETEEPVAALRLQGHFLRRGVWIRPFGRLVYLMPPYVTPAQDTALLCDAVTEALQMGLHLGSPAAS